MKLPEWLRKPSGPVQLKPDQTKVSGYFNVDNGSGRLRGIYLEHNAGVAPIFEQWIAPLKDLGVTTLTMRNTGGTDHENFDAVGIPGFQFIQDPLDYGSRTHHTNMDTYERLQAEDLAQAATVEATSCITLRARPDAAAQAAAASGARGTEYCSAEECNARRRSRGERRKREARQRGATEIAASAQSASTIAGDAERTATCSAADATATDFPAVTGSAAANGL